MPFLCLTNGGGYLEKDKASSVNRILQIESSNLRIEGE